MTAFYKYQGTGNDFVILDNRDGMFDSISATHIKLLCNRRFGIGGDGLMLLNNRMGYDFEMKYYNSDGNESTMCGNGGRCLVQFAADMGMKKETFHFLAIDGEHRACIADNGWIKLQMKDVSAIKTINSDSILDTGSPHYVKLVNDVEHEDVYNRGRDIRYSDTFNKEGINVNFAEVMDNAIHVRTYERGVENETLSCGTGVTAVALVCAHNDAGFNYVSIHTPGGQLAVEFNKTGRQSFTNIWLCGPASLVFTGEVNM